MLKRPVHKRRGSRKIHIHLVLIALLLLCSMAGCVYLRLLSLKNQFARFEENFSIEAGARLALHFNNPVLYDTDIIELTNLQPSRVDKNPDSSAFVFHFAKQEKAMPAASGKDLVFLMNFNRDRKLEALVFSEAILKLVPPEFLELSLRSLGYAEVDKKRRQLRADSTRVVRRHLHAPGYDAIRLVLGDPMQEERTAQEWKVVYEYRLNTPTRDKQADTLRRTVVTLWFDPVSRELDQLSGNFAGLKLTLHYERMIQKEYAESKTR